MPNPGRRPDPLQQTRPTNPDPNPDPNPNAQVLKSGKDARGQAVIPEEEVKKHVGKGIGFSTLAVRHRLAVCRDGVEWMNGWLA